MVPHPSARRLVSWVLLVAAVVVSVMSMVSAFTSDPSQGEGWIAGPIEVVFMGVPLFMVGLGLRSDRPEVARRTAIASAVLLLAVAFVLVMQLLDPNEILSDRLVQAAGLVLYGAALLTELPALAHRVRVGPRSRPVRPST